MGIALKELLRQPQRFTAVGGALTLLVVLLVVLGGFLDGLELNQTGPYRAHEGQLLVFADDSELQIDRSRIDDAARDRVADVDGVTEVGRLGQLASTAGVEGADELQDVVLFGYDLATARIPAPPPQGAVVDAALGDLIDLAVGDTLLVGPSAEPLVVAEIVDDVTQGAPTIWLATDAWRDITSAARPGAIPAEGVSQALVVSIEHGSADDRTAVAEQIDAAADVTAVTPAEAIEGLPVVQQQSSTFAGIIGVTFAVTLLVVALFFALITLERVGLYAVLKALGARTGDLVAGVSVQAVGVSLVALAAGMLLSLGFVALLPPDLPIRLEPARLAQIGAGTLVTALLGSLFTLRRILRIDPAEAIG